jgi:hypothetical protein
VAAAGIALPFVGLGVEQPRQVKNWAWMKAEVTDFAAFRRQLAKLKAAGFHAVLMTGDADAYRKYLPPVREAGLELHAWMFTMMRGENLQLHPE